MEFLIGALCSDKFWKCCFLLLKCQGRYIKAYCHIKAIFKFCSKMIWLAFWNQPFPMFIWPENLLRSLRNISVLLHAVCKMLDWSNGFLYYVSWSLFVFSKLCLFSLCLFFFFFLTYLGLRIFVWGPWGPIIQSSCSTFRHTSSSRCWLWVWLSIRFALEIRTASLYPSLSSW